MSVILVISVIYIGHIRHIGRICHIRHIGGICHIGHMCHIGHFCHIGHIFFTDIFTSFVHIFLFRQVESDLTSAQNHREIQTLLAKQKSLSQRVCARCGEGFSLLFNRRLECIDCNLGVCRKCCIWVNKSSTDKLTGWRCQSCQKER